MAIRYQNTDVGFTSANRNFQVFFDWIEEPSHTPENILITNITSMAGSSSSGVSESTLADPVYTGWNIKIVSAPDDGVIEAFRSIRPEKVRCTIIEEGIEVFNGWVLQGSHKRRLNEYSEEEFTIEVIDGFRYMHNLTFTREDYTNFLDPNNRKAQNNTYTLSGTHMTYADFLSEIVFRATGTRKRIGCYSDITYDPDKIGPRGTPATRFTSFAELLVRTGPPVGPLFGRSWGQILDIDLCKRFNCSFRTYRNDICFINNAAFGKEDGFTITYIGPDGTLEPVRAEWETGTYYKEGQVVEYDGALYTRNDTMFPDYTIDPVTDTENIWGKIIDWVSGTAYVYEDIVAYNNQVWFRNGRYTNDFTEAPGTSSNNVWDNIETRGTWVSGTVYDIGDYVDYNNSVYRHTTPGFPDTSVAPDVDTDGVWDTRDADSIETQTIQPLELPASTLDSSFEQGTDVWGSVNVHTYRGPTVSTEDGELSENELVNGDIDLRGADSAAGWG